MTSKRFPIRLLALAALVAAGLAASLAASVPAGASPKAATINGRIVFVGAQSGNADIYSVNPDGSDLVNLTNDPGDDSEPAVSSDGTKITWISNRDDGNLDVYVMNADGSNVQRLTTDPEVESWPSFSPDGTRIVFGSNLDIKHDADPQIYRMDVDGTHLVRLTTDNTFDDTPRYSPDGTKIAFTSFRDENGEVYVMNADGSNQTNISNNNSLGGFDGYPSWSPDGKLITFESTRDLDPEIYTMKPDGSDQTNFSNDPAGNEMFPSFSPDGNSILFSSDRAVTGNPSAPAEPPAPDDRVWVASFPGGPPGTYSLVSGYQPVWAPAHAVDLRLADPPDVGPLVTGTKTRLAYYVSNDGNVDATDVTITATLPHLLAFVSAKRCTAVGRVVTCHLGTIQPGDADIVKFRVRVRRFPKDLSRRIAHVMITAASSAQDAHPADNSQVQQVVAIH